MGCHIDREAARNAYSVGAGCFKNDACRGLTRERNHDVESKATCADVYATTVLWLIRHRGLDQSIIGLLIRKSQSWNRPPRGPDALSGTG